MRDIKFRGRKEGSRVWDYGGYSKIGDKAFIISIGEDRISYTAYLRESDPNTIGQYTGLKDKNEVEIYEGDIMEIQYLDFDEYIIGYVFYNEKGAKFLICDPSDDLPYDFEDFPSDKFEVIGNIHDNPELLKEVEV